MRRIGEVLRRSCFPLGLKGVSLCGDRRQSAAHRTTVTGSCAAPSADRDISLMRRVQRSLSDQPAESSGPVTDQRRGEEFGDDAGRDATRDRVDAGLRRLLRDKTRAPGKKPVAIETVNKVLVH